MNNLWTYLQGLSLTANNQRWLGERLIEASKVNEQASEEDAKVQKLNALFGVWGGADGEQIETAIHDARVCDYERQLVDMDT